MYEQLQSLDSVKINFDAAGMHIINIILAIVMFGVALEIKISNFKEVIAHPKSLFLGLGAQLILLPLITFTIVALGINLIPPGVAMGMILVAACPGGNMSNFISALAKGNLALSVSLTGATTALAVFMTPLNFEIWGRLYVNFLNRKSQDMLQPLEISIPHMLFTLCILLVLPLIAGMLFAKYFPKAKEKITKPVKFISLFAFFIILAAALSNNINIFLHNLFFIFIIVLIHNGSALAGGYFTGAAFKCPVRDRRSLMIETGIQNSGLGLALLFNPKIFPEGVVTGGMLMVVAWWGIWHIVSGLTIAFACRYKKLPAYEEENTSI